ncbi:MAG: LysR family transcriptional regulator [Pseudomonadota bacterium]
MYNRLKTFIRISELSSLTLAAKSLYLTQPAVTQHVRFLENRYGLALIRRKGNGIELTPEGEQLYTMAKGALKKIDEIDQFFMDKELRLKETLRFSMIDSVAFSIASPAMKKLLKVNEDILLYPSINASAFVIRSLEEHEVDFGICVVDDAPKSLGIEVLFEEPLIFVGSEKDKKIKKVSELESKNFVIFPRYAKTRSLIDEVTAMLKFVPRNIVEVRKIAAIVAMIEAGMGISLVPYYTVFDDLRNKRIFQLPIKTEAKRSVGLIYRKDEKLPKAAIQFMQFLREEAKNVKKSIKTSS